VRIGVCAWTQAGCPRSNETEETGAERVGKNDIVLVAGVGVNGKNGGIFLTGEVFFLLTSPLMGDPEPTHLIPGTIINERYEIW